MLELRSLTKRYGSVTALDDVSLDIACGEFFGLLGPNGAGKSTLLAALSGTLRQRSGKALMDGVDLVAMPSHAIVGHGLAQVPEGRRMFSPLSVQDNLRLGTVRLGGRNASTVRERFDYVYTMFPRLAERRTQLAGTLSGGEQQMVAIGRALMSSPRVLLLDEPFLGLAPIVVDEIRRALDLLRSNGLTMVLVEQKLDIALAISQRLYVMGHGEIVFEGTPASLAGNAQVRREWLEV